MPLPQEPSAACQTFRLAADAALAEPAPAHRPADAAHARECAACAAWLRTFAAYRERLRAIGDALRAPELLRARMTAMLETDRTARPQ